MQAAPSRSTWSAGPLQRSDTATDRTHRAWPLSGPVSSTGQALRPPSPRFAGRRVHRCECGMSCIMKRVPRQRSFDGDALAAKLDEARASYNGTLVVAVAVHLDPDCRCCGADHACSVARGLERRRQRAHAACGELGAGSHGGVNARCPASESPTLGRRYRRTRGWNRTTGPARDPRRARPRAASSPACCCRVRARTRHARGPAGPR
jgi:hypothetical protein